jgi:hypothetical protein
VQTLYGTLVAGGVALLVAWLTARNTRRGQDQTALVEAHRLGDDGKRVDLSVLTESLDELRLRVESLSAELAAEHRARVTADKRATTAAEDARKAHLRADAAGRRATGLERRIAQLEQAMREADIAVPLPTD